MRPIYVAVMDKLYALCFVICTVSVVCMTVFIFTGVIMRYIFLVGARFAEPMSIFFAVQLTMYGAVACYRANTHLSLQLFVQMLPEPMRRGPQRLVQTLLAVISLFMVYYGANLVQVTWFQYYPEFEYVKVGLVYSAIPISGAIMFLFVIEAVLYPSAMVAEEEEGQRRTLEHAEEEARKLAL